MKKLLTNNIFDNKLFWQVLLYGITVILGDISQILYWVVIILGPFIFMSNKIRLVNNINARLAMVFYFITIIIVIFTALLSGNVEYPMKRALAMFSIFVSLFYFQNRIKCIKDVTAIYWAFIYLSMFLVILLFLFTFENRLLFNFEQSNWLGKNSSAAILFIGFISSFCVIYINKNTKHLLVLQIISLVSIIMTGSIKFIIFAILILLFHLFNTLKFEKSIKYLTVTIITVILAVNLLPMDTIIQTNEYRIVSSRILTTLGLREYAPIKVLKVTEGRESYIKEGFKIFTDNPVFGIGLENTRIFIGTYTHNTFVELLAGGGIILGITFFLFLFFILKGIFKIKHSRIKYFIILLFISIIIISQAQRIYDNRLVLMFLFSLIYIKPINKINALKK